MLSGTLKMLAETKLLRDLDWQFARWIADLSGDSGEALALAAALVSHRLGQGDVCVDLRRFAGQRLFADAGAGGGPAAPELKAWMESLQACPAVAVGDGVSGRPLVLGGFRLYLARYWHFETALAAALHRLARTPADIEAQRLAPILDRLFPVRTPAAENDGQRIAAALAALGRLCIISGGPGTGKTRTVTAILALLIELAQPALPRIVMAAPTGKAAARLTESVRCARAELEMPEAVKSGIPAEAMTLHRLIGVRPGRSTPRHGPDNPLHLDILVVDEASMIDLPLMHRVVAALPAGARLILLGDKDQLASVEAGNVFADICAKPGRGYSPKICDALRRCAGYSGQADPKACPMGDCVALLEKSYRFGADSGIGALARAINAGCDPEPVLARGHADVVRADPGPKDLAGAFGQRAVEGYRPLVTAADAAQALERLEGFTMLCATREGSAGVSGCNRIAESALAAAGLISSAAGGYRGRPILITRNDYSLGVFNGDIGILWPDPADGALRAWFRQADGTLKKIAPGRLPDHDTAFAMTVHKAQGSEFDRVLLLLPDHDVRVLTRELPYTAVTRARSSIEIWGKPDLLRTAASRTAERASGLAERLWDGASG